MQRLNGCSDPKYSTILKVSSNFHHSYRSDFLDMYVFRTIQKDFGATHKLHTVDYFIAFWQSVDGFSPVHGAVNCLAMTFVLGPAMIITGASITITKTYRIQLWIGWSILIIGMGAFTTVRFGTPVSHPLAFSALVGLGGGTLYSAQYFPVLAPLPITDNAHALALFSFFRSFASVWAVTIGGTVLQNQLVKRLPESFTSQFSGGAALAYAAIPVISDLQEPLRTQVREAFADSIRIIWQVMIGIAGLGLLCSLPMKALPLHTQVDEKWGIDGGSDVASKTAPTEDLERMLPHVE